MRILQYILISMAFAISVHGQTALQLKEKFRNGVTDESLKAILDAGDSANPAIIPYLKQLALQTDSDLLVKSIPSYAQIALAKLGEESYLLPIVKKLDDPDIFVQDVSIQRLSLVGGKRMYREFYRLLDDTKYRYEDVAEVDLQKMRDLGATGLRKGDQILEPRSFAVMKLLSKMVGNPPVYCDIPPSEKHISLWKKWFEEHKELID